MQKTTRYTKPLDNLSHFLSHHPWDFTTEVDIGDKMNPISQELSDALCEAETLHSNGQLTSQQARGMASLRSI